MWLFKGVNIPTCCSSILGLTSASLVYVLSILQVCRLPANVVAPQLDH